MEFIVNYEKLVKVVEKLKKKPNKTLDEQLLLKNSEDRIRDGEEMYKMCRDAYEHGNIIDKLIKEHAKEKRRNKFVEENKDKLIKDKIIK